MITNFKIYENVDYSKIKIGDWIIDTDDDIGEIIQITELGTGLKKMRFIAWYETLKKRYDLRPTMILHFGSTKEEMETILAANKYNI